MRYKIGDLARLFNLSTESIRHYERPGADSPAKGGGFLLPLLPGMGHGGAQCLPAVPRAGLYPGGKR